MLFAGGDIHTAAAPNGARGYTDGKTLYVRADDPDFTAEQIALHEAGHVAIARGETDLDKVRQRVAEVADVETASKLYEMAYAGSGMTLDEIWEEIVCDVLGGMNIFRDVDASAEGFMDNFLAESWETVENSRQVPRSPPAESGGYSRYWKPNLTKREWSLLNRRMDMEIGYSGKNLDPSTKWLYATEKGTSVFAIYGVGDGTVPTVLYASGRNRATNDNGRMQTFLEGRKNEANRNRTALNRLLKDIESGYRDTGGGVSHTGNRGATAGNVPIPVQKREGNRDGNSGAGAKNRKDGVKGKYSARLFPKDVKEAGGGIRKHTQGVPTVWQMRDVGYDLCTDKEAMDGMLEDMISRREWIPELYRLAYEMYMDGSNGEKEPFGWQHW